ncbi:hypothetical protein [Capnocytophaga gingivalis]|jgi:hypothetical protein
MKKILVFLAIGLLLGSCSDKLTSSKAEKLIQEALGKEPIEDNVQIKIGEEVLFSSYDFIIEERPYSKLKEDGMIEMTFIRTKPWSDDRYYSVQLTDKGKQYLTNIEVREDKYKNCKLYTMKSHSIRFNKVEEIHLIPERNMAYVKASFKIEKTPFFVLNGLNSGLTSEREHIENGLIYKYNIPFTKLEEKGWKVEPIYFHF